MMYIPPEYLIYSSNQAQFHRKCIAFQFRPLVTCLMKQEKLILCELVEIFLSFIMPWILEGSPWKLRHTPMPLKVLPLTTLHCYVHFVPDKQFVASQLICVDCQICHHIFFLQTMNCRNIEDPIFIVIPDRLLSIFPMSYPQRPFQTTPWNQTTPRNQTTPQQLMILMVSLCFHCHAFPQLVLWNISLKYFCRIFPRNILNEYIS